MKNDNRYGGNRDRFDGDRRYDRRDNRREDDAQRGNRGRRPYGENRFDGPGRRTYGDRNAAGQGFDARERDNRYAGKNPPRVGRVVHDVPRAQRVDADMPAPRRVTGDRDYGSVRREDFVERDFGRRSHNGHDYGRGGDLHRGGAWRSESGPRDNRPYDRRDAEPDYEAPEIPEELLSEFTDAPGDEHLLAGRNPIREALRAGRPMEKLLVASGDLSGSGREIIRMAQDAGVVVQQVDRARLDKIYPAQQGILAYVAAVPYTELSEIVAAARQKGEDPFIVLLDGITDPHNLGAIIRSAECAGAHGVVIPERRAAGLSPAAAKAAAGALNHMSVARVKNLNRAIDDLKAEGIWIIGTAMDGTDAFTADLTGPVAVVIGSEGDGISKLTREKCDRMVSLPIKGHIDSLNASVAAGVLMYEIVRQRAK